ncbi:MAG: SPFH domain-containing protein [Bacteroidetes bacterium]|nr:SPFH domain-containing protein [Bacteroidota bacterium]
MEICFDISKSIDQLNLILRTELQTDFNGLGLQIHDFYIQSISVPDEVQKMIDTRSGMGALGNLDQYMKFKVATQLEIRQIILTVQTVRLIQVQV